MPVNGPFVLTHFEKSAQRIYCLNDEAKRAGLHHGLSFADARALFPDLTSAIADPIGDRHFLNVLGRWAERYCPIVAADGSDGLLLDISGASHLFGGEQNVVDDLLGRLGKIGVHAQLGLADTVGAAWAVARFAGVGPDQKRRQSAAINTHSVIVPCDNLLSALCDLPVEALRIGAQMASDLKRLGISTIHDLTQLPRHTLSRRFGSNLLTQLDLALGNAMEPITPLRQEVRFSARISLPEPVGLAKDVLGLAERLMQQICEKLQASEKGARRLRLVAQRVDSTNEVAEIGLARPMRDPVRMTRLFERAVNQMEAGFGIERMWLEVTEFDDLRATQTSHIDKTKSESSALADLISRIVNRVGFEHVQRYLPAQSHIPEKSFLIVPAAYSEPDHNWSLVANRPLTIFPPEPVVGKGAVPPQHIRWRNMTLQVVRVVGPERLMPEWWLDDANWRSGLRDYWRVETIQGRRLWLFHTPQVSATHLSTWFVHGEFA